MVCLWSIPHTIDGLLVGKSSRKFRHAFWAQIATFEGFANCFSILSTKIESQNKQKISTRKKLLNTKYLNPTFCIYLEAPKPPTNKTMTHSDFFRLTLSPFAISY